MIDRPAPNADFLDRPEVRSKLRARPVATYLGARRGLIGYALLVIVAAAGAANALLGVALALVPAHALYDWIVSWYRVASLPYHQAVEQTSTDRTEPPEHRDGTEGEPDDST
jgi:heme A synthase